MCSEPFEDSVGYCDIRHSTSPFENPIEYTKGITPRKYKFSFKIRSLMNLMTREKENPGMGNALMPPWNHVDKSVAFTTNLRCHQV